MMHLKFYQKVILRDFGGMMFLGCNHKVIPTGFWSNGAFGVLSYDDPYGILLNGVFDVLP
jgi:hypothetical protein